MALMKGIKPYKGPKPHIGLSENPKKFARGMDPISATKKLFLYKDIFGNMGGPPTGKVGPPKQGLGQTPPGKSMGPNGGVGNVGVLTAARRLGLI